MGESKLKYTREFKAKALAKLQNKNNANGNGNANIKIEKQEVTENEEPPNKKMDTGNENPSDTANHQPQIVAQETNHQPLGRTLYNQGQPVQHQNFNSEAQNNNGSDK